MSEVLRDQRTAVRMKGKVQRAVLLYGFETVALRKGREAELQVAMTKC